MRGEKWAVAGLVGCSCTENVANDVWHRGGQDPECNQQR